MPFQGIRPCLFFLRPKKRKTGAKQQVKRKKLLKTERFLTDGGLNNMKKALLLSAAAMVMAGSFSTYTFAEDKAPSGADSLKIVTTIFPEYDWVMNILGDRAEGAEVTMLLDNGVDLHSYQPTVDDILKISTCDLFIYVGGESDGWVDDALQEATNDDMVVIDLLETLGDTVKEEEVVEGMQEDHHHDHGDEEHDEEEHDHDEAEEHDEEEHDHDEAEEHDEEEHDHDEAEEHDEEEHDHDEAEEYDKEEHDHDETEEHDEDGDHEEEGHHHEDGEIEYDEHVWLSLRNASVLVESICTALQTVDPDNSDVYSANAAAYTEKLAALDAEYETAVSEASVRTLLFGDRFPFRYLVDDYGLSYYAAFVGCSAETEASFETVIFLAEKVNELSLHTIMTIEGSDQKIAESIRQSTKTADQQILTLDSMQSVTAEDVAEGANYMSIMESNLEVLKEALK